MEGFDLAAFGGEPESLGGDAEVSAPPWSG